MKQRTKLASSADGRKIRSSQTGKVGTSFYVAPELHGDASIPQYGKKADIYSLGIIFFEMLHPPFETSMERDKTLSDIGSINIKFPNSLNTEKFATEIGVCILFKYILYLCSI